MSGTLVLAVLFVVRLIIMEDTVRQRERFLFVVRLIIMEDTVRQRVGFLFVVRLIIMEDTVKRVVIKVGPVVVEI